MNFRNVENLNNLKYLALRLRSGTEINVLIGGEGVNAVTPHSLPLHLTIIHPWLSVVEALKKILQQPDRL